MKNDDVRGFLSDWALAARLARREMRSGLRGFRVFLACLALGVAAITGVQVTAQGVLAGLAADGRALLGGDVAVRQLYRPFDPEQRAYLAAAGRVTEFASLRSMARTPDGGAATLVEVKAVDTAYPLVGDFALTGGGSLATALAEQGGEFGAVAEPGLLDRLGVGIGDTLVLGTVPLRLRGIIAREPDRIGSGGFSLGPRLMVSRDALAASGLEQPGALIFWNARVALNDGIDAADWRDAAEARYRNDGWSVRDFHHASPQLQRFVVRLGQLLTLVGLTTLLVGGVGVANAVRAHLDANVATVATLRCLGASSRLIWRVYLLQVMVLAALGTAIGLLAGFALPWGAVSLLGDLLPAQARIELSPAVIAVSTAFGLLTALTFALWPLGRVHDIAPAALFRDAIVPAGGRPRLSAIVATVAAGGALAALTVANAGNRPLAAWFVAGALAAFTVFRLAAYVAEAGARRVPRHRLTTPAWRLAVANLHRPGNATAATVLSLGLGLTVLAAIALVQGNFARRVTEALPATAPSFFFIDIQRNQYAEFATAVSAMPGAHGFQAVPSLRGRIVAVNGKPAADALIDRKFEWVTDGDRGVSYADRQPSDAPIVAGQWWPERYAGPPLLSIDDDVARAFAIGPGDRLAVSVLGRTIEATVANVRHIDFSTMALNFILVFSPGVLDAAPHSWVAAIHTPPDQEAALQKAVVSRWPGVTTIRLREALETAARVISDVGTAARAVVAVALLAGLLVLAGSVAAGHRRRVADALVFKVLGASRRQILTAYALEYGILGAIAAILAGGFGTLAAWGVVTATMEFEWSFMPGALVATTIVAVAAALVPGLIGAWRALGVPAAPLLRNE